MVEFLQSLRISVSLLSFILLYFQSSNLPSRFFFHRERGNGKIINQDYSYLVASFPNFLSFETLLGPDPSDWCEATSANMALFSESKKTIFCTHRCCRKTRQPRPRALSGGRRDRAHVDAASASGHALNRRPSRECHLGLSRSRGCAPSLCDV